MVRRLRVVAPQRPRQPQQGHVGSSHFVDVAQVNGREVGGELRHLAATSERDNDHADDYRGGHDDQHH